ncbi:MAG TPA: DUF4038 domain-containing protein [Planctomycetes bacterium]|nr:DUF4038 domain-containing protein [Planctomycetota bacterium]HIL36846.1 DUF4038 domain-containing protein [Planctomycetota bacterium]
MNPTIAAQLLLVPFLSCGVDVGQEVEANRVVEIELESIETYENPFVEIELDAVFTGPDGEERRIPAFWGGGNRWSFRYSSSVLGVHAWRTECTDKENTKLHGATGLVEVVPYRGLNPLHLHGPIRVADDHRHFEHSDGTPFLWLGDTWWKGLCKRFPWAGFQELTADRRTKGFNVVQIVCGPYPDEDMMEASWENEGGKPYETRDFSVVNPEYFNGSDRRLQHLVGAGIVPAIVGGWGRPQRGGMSTISQVGVEGYKRHWRHLVARYGAFPVVWIVGGEAKDSQGPWSQVANYLRAVDPYHRPLTYHAPGHPRRTIEDNAAFDFDMPAIGHDGLATASRTLDVIRSCLSYEPARPVLCGEACYEGHMQTNLQYIQRHLFWSFLLSGAAGHTYGAAGIWHSSVEGDSGITPVYDVTTWKEGMNYPGSTQLGLGKRLLEKHGWSRFEPHPEWTEKDCFAAGIPGEICIVYKPRRRIYDWNGPRVTGLDPRVEWHAYYFDPVTGRIFDQGTIEPSADAHDGSAKPVEFKSDVPSPQDWVLVLEAKE